MESNAKQDNQESTIDKPSLKDILSIISIKNSLEVLDSMLELLDTSNQSILMETKPETNLSIKLQELAYLLNTLVLSEKLSMKLA